MATGSSGILRPHCMGTRKKRAAYFSLSIPTSPLVWIYINPDCAKCPPHSNTVSKEEDLFAIQDQWSLCEGKRVEGGVVIIRIRLFLKGQNAKQTKKMDRWYCNLYTMNNTLFCFFFPFSSFIHAAFLKSHFTSGAVRRMIHHEPESPVVVYNPFLIFAVVTVCDDSYVVV